MKHTNGLQQHSVGQNGHISKDFLKMKNDIEQTVGKT